MDQMDVDGGHEEREEGRQEEEEEENVVEGPSVEESVGAAATTEKGGAEEARAEAEEEAPRAAVQAGGSPVAAVHKVAATSLIAGGAGAVGNVGSQFVPLKQAATATVRQRCKRFSADELMGILDIVDKVMPLTDADWETVAALYNKSPIATEERTGKSLMAKFRSIRTRYSTVSAVPLTPCEEKASDITRKQMLLKITKFGKGSGTLSAMETNNLFSTICSVIPCTQQEWELVLERFHATCFQTSALSINLEAIQRRFHQAAADPASAQHRQAEMAQILIDQKLARNKGAGGIISSAAAAAAAAAASTAKRPYPAALYTPTSSSTSSMTSSSASSSSSVVGSALASTTFPLTPEMKRPRTREDDDNVFQELVEKLVPPYVAMLDDEARHRRCLEDSMAALVATEKSRLEETKLFASSISGIASSLATIASVFKGMYERVQRGEQVSAHEAQVTTAMGNVLSNAMGLAAEHMAGAEEEGVGMDAPGEGSTGISDKGKGQATTPTVKILTDEEDENEGEGEQVASPERTEEDGGAEAEAEGEEEVEEEAEGN